MSRQEEIAAALAEVQRRKERQQEIDDIRELLDFYEKNPTVPIPRQFTVKHIVRDAADRERKATD